MRSCFIALGAALMILSRPSPGLAQQPGFGHYLPEAQYAEQVSSTFYLAMRDGVRLALRVTRPARGGVAVPGPFPVIWQHALSVSESPPGAAVPAEAGLNAVPELTAYGYVVVQVARRGNGQSFGIRRGYNDVTETDDAYEVTEWLARQPWSTGAVGIYGCSNTGDAAMHALSGRPPHLKAVFAGCFSWSKYDAMRRGGVFAQWGTGPQRTVAEDMQLAPVEGDTDKTLLGQAAAEHQQSTNLLELWRQMPYRDSWSAQVGSRFWSEGSISSYAEQLRQLQVPVYIMGGWHDELRDQGIVALLNLPHSRILIGPWRHCMNPGFELLQEIHRFFDTYLKGLPTGLEDEPRVHYFTMAAGAGAWQAAASWPITGSRSERWFVVDARHLQLKAPRRETRDVFTVRTDVDCPEGGVGPFMQPCVHPGQGLALAGPALRQAATVTGHPIVSLNVRVDRADANVFAYLTDIAPDGTSTVVTEGRLKASLRAESPAPFAVPDTPWHRAYAQDARPLTPGQTVTLHFELLPTSYRFAAGHHIGLTVMGADYRERLRDPAAAGAAITLVSSAAAPSWLDLPVSPGGALSVQAFGMFDVVCTGDLVLDEPDPDHWLGGIAAALRAASVTIGHLEVPHTHSPSSTSHDVPAPGAAPEHLAALQRAGVDAVTLAGNHIADCGAVGIEDTLRELERLGIGHVGAAGTLALARDPAWLTRGATQLALLSFNCVGPEESWAQADRAGCAYVRIATADGRPAAPAAPLTHPDPASLALMAADIRAARERGATLCVVALHKGVVHTRAVLAPYERAVAHAAIEAGADAVISHHAHILRGIEFHRGRPIFHGLGNGCVVTRALSPDDRDPRRAAWARRRRELFGFEPDPAYYLAPFHPEAVHGMLARFEVGPAGITAVGFVPLHVEAPGRPVLAHGDQAIAVCRYVEAITREAGLPPIRLETGTSMVRVAPADGLH